MPSRWIFIWRHLGLLLNDIFFLMSYTEIFWLYWNVACGEQKAVCFSCIKDKSFFGKAKKIFFFLFTFSWRLGNRNSKQVSLVFCSPSLCWNESICEWVLVSWSYKNVCKLVNHVSFMVYGDFSYFRDKNNLATNELGLPASANTYCR